jgi:hypothetical protein
MMKALLTKAVCLVIILRIAGFAQTYTTSFTATENPISEGGKWVNGKTTGLDWNDVQTIPGRAYGASIVGGYDDDIAVLTTAFGANQYAQGTVYRAAGYPTSGGNHEIELLLRFRITAHSARGYETLWGRDGGMAIVRWNGPAGDYTPLLDGVQIGAAVDGDVLRVEISGSTIKVYKNGNVVGTATNSTYTDGQPGMGFWPTNRGGVTISSYGWKNYEAGTMGTQAEQRENRLTAGYTLMPGNPNPFKTSTRIAYGVAAGENAPVALAVFDPAGRCVRILAKKSLGSGSGAVLFDGRDDRGMLLPAGVYLCKLEAGKQVVVSRLVLLR